MLRRFLSMKNVIVVGVIVLVSALIVWSKLAQHRREATYALQIASFQRELRSGMSRADVERYLDSRGLNYRAVGYHEDGVGVDAYEIEIAKEPSFSLICEEWRVYIAMRFTPSDKLRDVRIKKVGTCL